jgi:adenosylmethionine-8-amino-7-oxononanoate aminotransferase
MGDLSAFRQCGMIAAMTVDSPDLTLGAKICLAARKHGLLTRPIGNTLVLMPPLCVTLDEIERMVAALRTALAEVIAAP